MSHVRFEHDGRQRQSSARFVLDCSGRAGVIARQGYRRYEAGHRMQALIGIWERHTRERGWNLPDETADGRRNLRGRVGVVRACLAIRPACRRDGEWGDDES